MKIRTVLGDVEPDSIGITLIHEHFFFDMSSSWDDDHVIMDFEGQKQEVAVFQEQGGDCVVDHTNIGMGRQPAMLKRFAEETGLHIVVGTGFYREPWLPEIVQKGTPDEIADVIVREIEEGIEDTDIRAGLIGEIGSTEFGTTELEEKNLRAAARAHLRTGAPISTHTMGGAEALRQIKIFEEEGVDLGKMLISHVDLDHFEHLRMVAEYGVFLGFDTIGKSGYRLDEIRLGLLRAIVKAGHADQVVLSHDISRASYLKRNGGHGYGHLLGEFVPALREVFPKEVIQKFLVTNPRCMLTF